MILNLKRIDKNKFLKIVKQFFKSMLLFSLKLKLKIVKTKSKCNPSKTIILLAILLLG